MKRLSLFLSVMLLLLTSACSVMLAPESAAPNANSGSVNDPQPANPTPAVIDNTGSTPAVQAPAAGSAATDTPAVTSPATNAPVAEQPTGGAVSDEQFDAQLAQAIERKDFAALRSIMGSSFTLAYWRSEGNALSPDAAIEQLRQGALAPNATPASAFGVDTSALLEGADPLNFFPPDAARAFYLDFIGVNGADQAIAIVGRDPASGQRYFKGMLVAMGGFRQADPGTGDLNQFSERLADAVENRSFEAMRALMYGKFLIATFNQSLYGYGLDESIDTLRGSVFAPGSAPAVRWGTDVPALLGGKDPLGEWGPVAQPVRAAHVMGLNSNGGGEAVLVIGRDPNSGQFYWLGILLPENGVYFQAPGQDQGPVGDAQPTTVRSVEALEALNARSGPGLNYAVEGRLRQGEIAQVTGISRDSAWWQISCTQDSSGRCWISADPTLTRATN